MAAPQSETARRLFRALGRDPDQCGGGATVVYAYTATPTSYSDYVDSYNSYLQAVGNVQAAAPAAAQPRRLKARGPRRDGRGRYASRAD